MFTLPAVVTAVRSLEAGSGPRVLPVTEEELNKDALNHEHEPVPILSLKGLKIIPSFKVENLT